MIKWFGTDRKSKIIRWITYRHFSYVFKVYDSTDILIQIPFLKIDDLDELFHGFEIPYYRGFSLKWSNHLSGVTEVQISKVYHFEWMYHLSGCIIWVELLGFFFGVYHFEQVGNLTRNACKLRARILNHPSISHRCSRNTL